MDKKAKEEIKGRYQNGSMCWDSQIVACHAHFHFLFREVAQLAYVDVDDYDVVVNVLSGELSRLRAKHGNDEP